MGIIIRSHPERITFSLPVDKSRPLRDKPKAEIVTVFTEAGCKDSTNVGLINGTEKLEIVPFEKVPDDAVYTGNGIVISSSAVMLPFGLGRLSLMDTTKCLPVFRKK